jgi:hypothetical protein
MEAELSIFRSEDMEYDRLAELDTGGMLNQIDRNEEIKNVETASYYAIGGMALITVNFILSVILAVHDPCSTFIWQSLVLGFSLLFGVYCFVWARRAIKALQQAREPIPIQTAIIFQVSLFLMIYHVVQMFWLIEFRPIHYNYLLSLRANHGEWVRKFGTGRSFEAVWSSDKTMLSFITFFEILIAISFGVFVFSARSLHSQKYFLSRMALYTSLIIVSVSSWMAVYWVFETYTYEKSMPSDLTKSQNDIILCYVVIAIILGIGNSIVNLNRKKTGYLFFAFLAFILGLSIFSSSGLIMQDAKDACLDDIFSKNHCRLTMVAIHEKNLDESCPVGKKYLPATENCKKEDIVYRWEGTDPSDLRSLNPACCEVAKIFYIKPYMNLVYWGLTTVFTLFAICVFNLVLMDYDGSRLWVGRVTRVLDVVSIGAVAICFITFLTYFMIRERPPIYHGSNPEAERYMKPYEHQLPNLKLVPESIKQEANATVFGPKCFPWHSDVYPTIDYNSESTICKTDCAHRIAVLVKKGSFKVSFSALAKKSMIDTKILFYPGCNDSQDGHLYFFGSIEGVKELIKGSLICPNSNSAPIVYIKQTQVPKSALSQDGLTSEEEERVKTFGSYSTGVSTCGDQFKEEKTCLGDCQILFDTSKLGVLEKVKGKLYFLDPDGRTVYDNVPPTVKIEALRAETKVGTGFSLYEGGIWTLDNIMRVYNFSYVLTLNISDSSKRFLPKLVDIIVPPEDVTTTELSAGKIRLLTPDGKVCNLPSEKCPTPRESPLKGTLRISVNTDSNTQQASTISLIFGLDTVSVQLIKGHRVSGEVIQVIRSFDTAGRASFSDLEYGSYTVLAKKDKHLDTVISIDLQDSEMTLPTIILQPINSDNDMIVTAKMTDPNIDYDLNLVVEHDQGFKCIVNPYNKYCAYAMFVNDVTKGVGEETILIKRMAMANYMAYVAPAEPYTLNCQLGTEIDTSSKHYSDKINWKHLVNGDQNKLPGIIVSTTNLDQALEVDSSGLHISSLKVELPVETPEQARIPKKLIGKDGEDYSKQNIRLVTEIRKDIVIEIDNTLTSQTQQEEPSNLSEATRKAEEETDEDSSSGLNKLLNEPSSNGSGIRKEEREAPIDKSSTTRAVTQTISESTHPQRREEESSKAPLSSATSPVIIEHSSTETDSEEVSLPIQRLEETKKSKEVTFTTLKAPEISDTSSHSETSTVSASEVSVELMQMNPIIRETKFPAAATEEELKFMPDTIRFEDESLDSAAYDASLQIAETAGDLRSVITAVRQRGHGEDGSNTMSDNVKNKTTITTEKLLESAYLVNLSLSQNGLEKKRVVGFSGNATVSNVLAATRTANRSLSVNNGIQETSFKDVKVVLRPNENITLTNNRIHKTGPQTDDSLHETTCVRKMTLAEDDDVCRKDHKIVVASNVVDQGWEDTRRYTNLQDGRKEEMIALLNNKTLQNGTKINLNESITIKSSKEIPHDYFKQSELYHGPLENDLELVNKSKHLNKTLQSGSVRFLNNTYGQGIVKGKEQFEYFRSQELNTSAQVNSSKEESHRKEMIGTSILYRGSNTSHNASFKGGSNVNITIHRDYLEDQEKQNNTLLTISTVEHDRPLNGLMSRQNVLNKTIIMQFKDEKYSPQKLTFDRNSKLDTTLVLKKDGFMVMQDSNQTVEETQLRYFNGSNSTTRDLSNTSIAKDNSNMKVTSTLKESLNKSCETRSNCKSSHQYTLKEEHESGKTIVKAESLLLTSQPVTSYKTNTTTVDFKFAGGSDFTSDSKTIDQKSDGSLITTDKFEQNKAQDDSNSKLKSSLKIEKVETIEPKTSPVLSKRYSQKSSSSESTFPKKFTSVDKTEESSLLMKDKTLKITLKKEKKVIPGEKEPVDKVDSSSYFLMTSLADDVDKPKNLKEFVLRNESSVYEFTEGELLKKTVTHEETSKTDSQFNQTVESHVVVKSYRNGSLAMHARKVVGLEVIANGTIFSKRNYSHSLKDGDKVELKWSYTYYQVNKGGKAILLEQKSYPPAASHLQTPSQERKRILQDQISSIDLINQRNSFILVSCFTGFGRASLIEVNQIVPNLPTMQDCASRLKSKKPYFTLEMLRKAYADKLGK